MFDNRLLKQYLQMKKMMKTFSKGMYADLDVFYPDPMVQRILGMGDVLSLIENGQSRYQRSVAMPRGWLASRCREFTTGVMPNSEPSGWQDMQASRQFESQHPVAP